MKEYRLPKRALFLFETAALLCAAVLFCVILFVFVPGTWLWYLLLWLDGALYVLTAFLYLPLFYISFSYRVSERELLSHSGVLLPKSRILYRSRIAFVTLARSPLSTLFGLSTLTVHAAGGTLSYHLLKREEAEKLAAELTEALV